MRHCETAFQLKSKQSQILDCFIGASRLLAMTMICLILSRCIFAYADMDSNITLPREDRLLLKQIQKDSLQYFITYTDPETGLTQDSSRSGSPASIAATGFALASFGIASVNGWLTYREAYEKIERTLTTLEQRTPNERGFFYHFLDPKTGKRVWNSEISSVDTALLIAGALIASSYFKGTGLEIRVKRLYDRVDWNWMRNGSNQICHGWKPKEGFLPYYWDMYSEHLILQALALGAETRAVPETVWKSWERQSENWEGNNIVYSYTGSLFTYQYSHAFIDFRNLNDDGINYFENSTFATEANQKFCFMNQNDFKTYQNGIWGLSASLGPNGYQAYGAEPGNALHDGTIAPYAAIGSIPFTPVESMKVIRVLYEKYGQHLYGPYGFKDAFNLDQNWWASEYLGIDQGIVVMMIENQINNGDVWNRFMKLPSMNRWIERSGLRSYKSV